MERAMAENHWFDREGILRSADAIATQMLDPTKLREWIAEYPDSKEIAVGVITAGNIPLVGVFDLLCAAVACKKVVVKPSSKDRVLMEYVVEQLASEDITIGEVDGCDVIIMMGSDSAVRSVKSLYKKPVLARGSRSSIAVIGSSVEGLSDDVFIYSGLGCRNVSMVFLPRNFELKKLREELNSYQGVTPCFIDNYRQQRALLVMEGDDFVDGYFFTMVESQQFPKYISRVNYCFYDDMAEVEQWVDSNEDKIQCIATDCFLHPRSVAIGSTQRPTLYDYPDGVDTIKWILNRY